MWYEFLVNTEYCQLKCFKMGRTRHGERLLINLGEYTVCENYCSTLNDNVLLFILNDINTQ